MDGGWNIVHHGKRLPISQLSKQEKKKIETNVTTPEKSTGQRRGKAKGANGVAPTDVPSKPSWDKDRDIEQIDFSRAVDNKKKAGDQGTHKGSHKQAQPSVQRNKDTLMQLDVDDFQRDALQRNQLRFPSMPATWLVEVGAYLNTFFTSADVETRDAVKSILKESPDYPSSLLNEPCHKLLRQLIAEQTRDVATEYLKLVLPLVMRDTSRNQVTVGHRIVSQLVLRHIPSTLLTTRDMFTSLLEDNRSHAHRFCMLFWYLFQATNVCFRTSCRAFMDMLLPYVSTKAYGDMIVVYLEATAKFDKTDSKSHEGFTVEDFIQLLDYLGCVSPNNNAASVSTPLLERLKKLFSSLVQPKVLNSRRPCDQLEELFLHLLTRLNQRQRYNNWAQSVILSSLGQCLSYAPSCYDKWPAVLQSHGLFSGTKDLLEFLNEKKSRILPSSQLSILKKATCKIQSVCDHSYKVLSSKQKPHSIADRDLILETKSYALVLGKSCSSGNCFIIRWLKRCIYMTIVLLILCVAVDWWITIGAQRYASNGKWPLPTLSDWNKLRTVQWLMGLTVWKSAAFWLSKGYKMAYPYLLNLQQSLIQGWQHVWKDWLSPLWVSIAKTTEPMFNSTMQWLSIHGPEVLSYSSEICHAALNYAAEAHLYLYEYFIEINQATGVGDYALVVLHSVWEKCNEFVSFIQLKLQ